MVRRQCIVEQDQDQRNRTVILDRPPGGVVAQGGRNPFGHGRRPDRSPLPLEEERLVFAIAAQHTERVGLDRAQALLESEVARGALRRIELSYSPALRTGLLSQGGEEGGHGLRVGEVAQQLASQAAAQIAPVERPLGIEQGGAPAFAPCADRGAIAASEQGQAAVPQDEPAPALEPVSVEQLLPLKPGGELGDAAPSDAEQRRQVIRSDPWPVANQVERALLGRLEPCS